MIVMFGTKLSSSEASGRIKRLRMNSECQASSVTTRTGRFCGGIGAADEILHEKVALRGMSDEVGVEAVEGFRRHRLLAFHQTVLRWLRRGR